MDKQLPQTLYHYCSFPTFLKIIKNKSIWLSDISKSNDSLELKWIKDKCRYYILKVWTDYATAMKEQGKLEKVDFEEFDKIKNQIDDFYNIDTEKCWAFCLSEKQDDLGQWRGYADDGSGISIGFKSSYFENILDQHKPDPAFSSKVIFGDVLYTEEALNSLFYDECSLSQINPQMSSKEVIKNLRTAVVASLLLAPFYKNEYFSEEKEWRVAFTLLMKDLFAGKTPKTVLEETVDDIKTNYEYTIRGNDLVSHIELIDKNLVNNVNEIWVGPKCNLSSTELKLFLISTGFLDNSDDNSIRIYKSHASYQ